MSPFWSHVDKHIFFSLMELKKGQHPCVKCAAKYHSYMQGDIITDRQTVLPLCKINPEVLVSLATLVPCAMLAQWWQSRKWGCNCA